MNNEQLMNKPSAIISAANSVIDEGQPEVFGYDGFQVVRSEFLAHVSEPSISFNNCRVTFNSACLKKMPDTSYIQFLVNPRTKKLVIRSSSEDAKDSFLWCSSGDKRKPRQITCRMFFAMLADLMGWNPDCRYKLLGKFIKCSDELILLFDLMSTETFQRITKEGEKPKSNRTPIFPAEWKNQFGLPVAEHGKLLQINIFDGYTVFGLDAKNRYGKAESDIPRHPEISHRLIT